MRFFFDLDGEMRLHNNCLNQSRDRHLEGEKQSSHKQLTQPATRKKSSSGTADKLVKYKRTLHDIGKLIDSMKPWWWWWGHRNWWSSFCTDSNSTKSTQKRLQRIRVSTAVTGGPQEELCARGTEFQSCSFLLSFLKGISLKTEIEGEQQNK